MARLEPQEIKWVQNHFKRWTEAALEAPPVDLDPNKVPTKEELAAHNQSIATYNKNPVRQVFTQLETTYAGIKVKDVNTAGDLILEGGNVRDKALFQGDFNAFRDQRLGVAVEGPGFKLDDIKGITIPGLNMNNVSGMLSNPWGILNMANPLNWITSIGSIVWSVAKQIPIVDDFSGAVSEMVNHRSFSMKNGRMHQAAERMFADLSEADRATAVNELMKEYVTLDGKLPVPKKPQAKPNPQNPDASLLIQVQDAVKPFMDAVGESSKGKSVMAGLLDVLTNGPPLNTPIGNDSESPHK